MLRIYSLVSYSTVLQYTVKQRRDKRDIWQCRRSASPVIVIRNGSHTIKKT